MTTIAPRPEVEESEPEFKRLTAEEARKLRELNPSVSPWWVVAGQAAVGVLVAAAAGLLAGKPAAVSA
ncbi:MAG: ATP synthase subunit I, partial [Burkholderiaceae bacterium]